MHIKNIDIFIRIIILAIISAFIIISADFNIKNQDSKGFKVTQYFDLTGGQGSFYTITDQKGHLIVIDGGWEGNEAQVRQVIAYYKNHVDLWILSHPHQDHIGAFNKIYENPEGITIDKIYDSPVDYEVVKSQEKWDDIAVFEKYIELTKDATNINHLKRGDEFEFEGLHFQVFNSYDEYVTMNSNDMTNDSSLVIKISDDKSSILFMGDIKYQMEDTLVELFDDKLASDYIQAGHHGNWSFSHEFYEKYAKKAVLFDAPAWIMNDETYPANALNEQLKSRGIITYDHSTAPNVIPID